MLRVLLLYVLPLTAPTLLYALWRYWQLRRGGAPAGGGDVLAGAPWVRLSAAGVGLLALVLAVAALSGGGAPSESYVPPRIENGRVVPGETRPEPAPEPRR